MRVASATVALALLTLAVACTSDDVESPDTSTLTPFTTELDTPLAATALPSRTVEPRETRDPTPVVSLVIQGPETAHPGEELVYRLDYDAPGGVGVRIVWSTNPRLIYVDSYPIDGDATLLVEGSEDFPFVLWEVNGTGAVEVILRIPDDESPGSFVVGCYEPGTRVSACSNSITTDIE